MKKSDLKKAIKPLVKECIHEVLIEEGLLSNIVSEVASGLQPNIVVESKQNNSKQLLREKSQIKNDHNKKLKEQKKRMLSAIGQEAYNGVDLFEGTTPMSSQGSSEAKAGSVDLGSPHDSGVDISSLMGDASKIWDAMK